MSTGILIAGILLLVCYAVHSRLEMLPIAAAFFIATYSQWSEDMLPFPGGEMEASYFVILAIWPCLGAALKSGRQYMVSVVIRYVLFFIVGVTFLDAVVHGHLAGVDISGLVCFLVSVAVYLFLMGGTDDRWRFWAHIVAACVAACADLLTYYGLAVVFKMDPTPDPISVYRSNLLSIAPLVTLYSLPLLWVKAKE